MNEREITMESEDAEEGLDCTENNKNEKMIFMQCRDVEELREPIIKIETDCDPIDSMKFDGINLEDDIEKVEVTSQESSETDYKSLEPSIEISPLSIFPEIPEQNPTESIKSWLQRITETQNGGVPKKSNSTPVNQPNRVVKYQDLPYMGEMTLDNSKPRRGRKPKKADICHLIYKNYGTIFPGTPNPSSYVESQKKSQSFESKEINSDNVRNNVQNRIISSLLEKRLTQEDRRTKRKNNPEEPLNLCIRDLNQLKIRLHKNDDNTYSSEIKSEPQSDDDIEFVNETPSPSASIPADNTNLDPLKSPDNSTAPGNYVYWPNAGVFIHPMALQQHLMMYQKLTGGSNYPVPDNNSKLISESKRDSTEQRKLIPKLIRPKKSETCSEETENSIQDTKSKRNASESANDKSPAKRKRSAIFIPPIPTENTANPATEVSICKFKFTGGAKPSLQEKKMLSVDSGGNFRYYSGTGDKSMRGYEFFPRETLQQQINNTHGSSTGAFLQASGEKIYRFPPVEITGGKSSSDFLLTPELPTNSIPASIQQQEIVARQKKRKSRKSIQREKLEQTFKENGFLIQTQQLESAEGATYCKFRQLRKFTRYLFRSWKDHLPGNVRELQEGEKLNADTIEILDNSDSLSVNSNDMITSGLNTVPL